MTAPHKTSAPPSRARKEESSTNDGASPAVVTTAKLFGEAEQRHRDVVNVGIVRDVGTNEVNAKTIVWCFGIGRGANGKAKLECCVDEARSGGSIRKLRVVIKLALLCQCVAVLL